ncbi:multidrug effflux MFS transporter [Fimbriiglobus ruber]|uniref:Multidrug resistance transporter, Bcr/CflA family n=1 Tax=Fimbriiglobus ruber TaxID=1908690 RepID=A0A225DKL2_9BACT|nr:multidrug effflux MFS transporter [Fimbriiglobus ruber]OWK36687.1 Multidrug resistance transporter, Bcr/CflA family [Fimbriiglobus ruber]
MRVQRSNLFIISLLGSLSVVSPFAIDMYLSGFKQLAAHFAVEETTVSLTLSSYFIGLAFGQVIYGPLLDRFGRKRPLVFGLSLFVLASIGCIAAPDVYTLIALRFIQGFGGCVAQVASVTMVRDFFPVKESAKILSLLFLFIAASPLLAPSIGSLVMAVGSWKLVFVIMAVMVAAILALTQFLLPEGHQPDPSISLRPGPIVVEYFTILRHPRFATYALAGAFSFAGLFTYVAGSSIIFMKGFGLSEKAFSAIFAGLAAGFIGGSQLNVLLLRWFESETIFFRALLIQVVTGLIFVGGSWAGWYGLTETLVLLFVFLSSVGLTNPNASALALRPFTKNAGSASALLGFFQLGIGAVISTGIGASSSSNSFPIIAILGGTATIGLAILLVGRRAARNSPASEENAHPTKDAEPVQHAHMH